MTKREKILLSVLNKRIKILEDNFKKIVKYYNSTGISINKHTGKIFLRPDYLDNI